jgi:uncharacterized SAM-binding protein YcdF (DUF218 family)
MLPGELKPILTALALPPAAPLLLALLGVLIALRRRGAGLFLVTLGIAATFLFSTNGMALLLASRLMPEVVPARLQDVQQVQAVVVLGGDVLPEAREYGVAQPGPATWQRLRYAVWLARKTGKPLAFAGGVGWAAAGTDREPEGTVARRALKEEYGLAPQWVDDRSRDTAENAARMAELLHPAGLKRIALVTDATHMPRAVVAFRERGFTVLPAPTNFPIPRSRPVLEWMPSGEGIVTNRSLIKEWLGRIVARAS